MQSRLALSLLLLLRFSVISAGDNQNTGNTVTALYHGYIGHANMGDELVFSIFGHLLKDSLTRLGWTGWVTVEYESGNILHPNRGFNFNLPKYTFAVVGGGSLIEARYCVWTLLCEKTAPGKLPIYLHGTGTMYPRAGYHPSNLLCVQQAVGGGVRGPETNDVLRDLTARNSAPHLSFPILGDSGILASRIFPMHRSDVVESVDAKLAGGTAGVVCLSGNLTFGNMSLVDLVRVWSSKYTVVLMPTDPEDLDISKAAVHDAMAQQSDPSARQRIFINEGVSTFGVWLALLHRCNILITVRLHALIVATSTATPVRVSLKHPKQYDAKFKDFLIQTHGDNWKRFYLDPAKFDGSVETLDVLLRDVSLEQTDYRAAAKKTIAATYDAHLRSLSEFMGKVIPEKYKAFDTVHIRLDRFSFYAEVQLSFS